VQPDEQRPFSLQAPCTLTQGDFDQFAELSGDHNPIHVDPRYAQGTAFGATVSHGMLLYSRLRGLIDQALPGCAQQTQTLMFPAPVYADEALTLSLEGEPDGDGAVCLRMQVRKPDGRLGLDGAARIAASPAPTSAADPVSRSGVAPDMRAASAYPAFQALRLGDTAQVARSFRMAEVQAWADLAQQAAAPARVPEPLIAALFSYLLGEKTPGHGTNYLKQTLAFHAVARVNEPLTARVTITRLRPDKALVNLATECTGEHGRLLCTGEALVLFQC